MISIYYYEPCSNSDPHSFPTRRSSDLVRHHGETPVRQLPPGLLPRRARQYGHAPLEGRSLAGRLITPIVARGDRKSTRLNSSHVEISYAVFCLKKKKKIESSSD